MLVLIPEAVLGSGGPHLLLFRGIHIALAANNKLGALHGAIAPDFGIVAIVADDQADFQALRALGHEGMIARVPACRKHDCRPQRHSDQRKYHQESMDLSSAGYDSRYCNCSKQWEVHTDLRLVSTE
jgi:hypothetical protein